MVLPIAATPTISGEDARRFFEKMEENRKPENYESYRQEMEEAMELYEEVMRKAKL